MIGYTTWRDNTGDSLARALLERAGFTVQWHFNSLCHRLTWGQGPIRENEQATHAAQMLTLAGYRVDLDPGLTTHRTGLPAGPGGGYRLSDQLRALTQAMDGAETYDAAAALADQVAHDVHGLLPALTRFLQAAGQQAHAAGTGPGAWPTQATTCGASARQNAPSRGPPQQATPPLHHRPRPPAGPGPADLHARE
ncbi:hypothetical protein OG900_09965 [Streptomyces sp. NBC_00433]